MGGLLRALIMVSLLCITAMHVAAQTAARTSWGDPDLQGIWDYRTATPLEIPADLGERQAFTTTEAAEFEHTSDERFEELIRSSGAFVGDEPWADRGRELTEGNRASLIIDPSDGRLPSRTEYGERRLAVWRETINGPPAGPEQRNLLERCVTNPAAVPVRSINFNNNLQLVQTPDHIVITYEMVHDARIIPLAREADRRIPSRITQYHGQSIGHWENGTLVVTTDHFKERLNPLGLSPDQALEERFTLVGGDRLQYTYTMDDPTSFTRPWTARQTFKRLDARIYEYACHEGNTSMTYMLQGARATERFEAED